MPMAGSVGSLAGTIDHAVLLVRIRQRLVVLVVRIWHLSLGVLEVAHSLLGYVLSIALHAGRAGGAISSSNVRMAISVWVPIVGIR